MASLSFHAAWCRRTVAALTVLVACAADVRPAAAYIFAPEDRWSTTASGSAGSLGQPVKLTWSFVPDGTNLANTGSSNLVSYMDGLFGAGPGGSDLTQRPWFTYFQQSFNRWAALGGITFTYEPNDDGSFVNVSSGVLGRRGDIRLGGTYDDGPGNTLAYTWFPDSGDMVIDTGETDFYSNVANNHRQFRDTVMHELGHAFGLSHVESSTDVLLMEPYINTSIDGPQLDDIRGIQGLYGDAFEKTFNGLGNGTAARAASLGSLGVGAGNTLDIGSDAVGGQSVGAAETDFVSIANSSDADFYSFTIQAPALLAATLTPLGGVFNQGAQGGTQSSFNANARNDLALSIFGLDGTTPLGSANLTGAGGIEALANISLAAAGKYYARITGADDNVQLYQLQLTAAALITQLAGDYNQDGTVDAADYTVWRDSFGASGSGLAADGDGDGHIDADDFSIWKNHFGATSGAGAGGDVQIGIVPEPATISLIMLAAGVLTLVRALRRNRDVL